MDESTQMSRRDMLRRGAVVGGTLVWAVPAVQSLSGVALAAPRGSVEGEKHQRKPPEVKGVKHERLPFTGTPFNPAEAAAIGGGLVVAGGAALEVARRRRRAALAGSGEFDDTPEL